MQEPGAAGKPGTSNSSQGATAASPGNHAYPPTAGTSAPVKPSQPSSSTAAPSNTQSAVGTSTSQTAGNHAYKPIGKDAKINTAGTSTDSSSTSTSGSAGNHAYPPTAGTSASSPSSSSAKPQQGSSGTAPSASASTAQQGTPRNAPSEAPSNHAYKPMGATAPVNTSGGGTSTSKSSVEKAGGVQRSTLLGYILLW